MRPGSQAAAAPALTRNQDRYLAALFLGFVAGALGSAPASAQSVYVTPSLTISEEYDDNVRLSSTSRQSDLITAVRPGLRLELRDDAWSLALAGSLRGEFFARRTDLTNTTDNQDATASLEYRPTAGFQASLADTYVRSVNPGDVDPQTGIIVGRFTSFSNSIGPALSYQFDPRTTGRFHYLYRILRADSVVARDSDTHEAEVGLEHQVSRRTSATLRYTFSHFRVEATPDQDSHAPRLGFVFAYSPTIRLSSESGLLWLERADGSRELTWSSTQRYDHEFTRGRLSLGYDRSASAGGVTGQVSIAQGFTAALNLQPARNLTLNLDASVRDTEPVRGGGSGGDVLNYAAGLRLSYRFLRWLSLEAGYKYYRQDDRKGPRDLERNVFSLGLTASDQFRAY